MKKKSWVTILIIIAVIILAIIIMTRSHPETDAEIAKCIGQNSELYVQLGCNTCKTQEEMFGENVKYLTIIDCWFDYEACPKKGVEYTPTWIIKGEKYEEVLSIKKLQELTGCQ